MVASLSADLFRSTTLRLAPGYVGARDLVPVSHALAGGVPEDRGRRAVLDGFLHDGGRWLVEAYACSRCACGALRLEFVRLPRAGLPAAEFDVAVDLAGAVPAIEVFEGITPESAEAVFSAWQATSAAGTLEWWREAYAAFQAALARSGNRSARRGCG